jgi:hypothetical protein
MSPVYVVTLAGVSANSWGSWVSTALHSGFTHIRFRGNCAVPHFVHLPPTRPRSMSRLR